MSSKTLLAAAFAAAISYAATGVQRGHYQHHAQQGQYTLPVRPGCRRYQQCSGFHLFAGKMAIGELRRGVLAFDIAGNIPVGSTITGVTFSMNMSRTPINVAYPVELQSCLPTGVKELRRHPERKAMEPGHPQRCNMAAPFLRHDFWAAEGGDFSATVSASQSVGVVGPYTWSSQQMVADVQDWLDNPAGNFGWLVLGLEKPTMTVKRFDTRESANPPVLTIEYASSSRPAPPRPRPTPRPRP